MKKLLLFLFISCSFCYLPLKAEDKGSYRLEFNIKGMPMDSNAYIGYFFGKNQYIKVDTAKIEANGHVVFTGKKFLEKGVYILTWPKNYLQFLVGDQDLILNTDTADFIDNANITKGVENKTFYTFQKRSAGDNFKMELLRKKLGTVKGNKKEEEKINNEIKFINTNLQKFRDSFYLKEPNSLTVKLLKAAQDVEVPPFPKDASGKVIDSNFQYYYYKNHYWDNMDLSDDAMVKTPFFHGKLESYFKNLVLQNADSTIKDVDRTISKMKAKENFKYTVWYLFNKYEEDKLMGMDAVLVHMAKEYYMSGKAYWVDTLTLGKIKDRVKVLDPLLLGKIAPNAYLTDSADKYLELYSVKAKQKILIFWDPDCGHCQKEIPALFKWAKEHEKQGVAVYAPVIVRKPEAWKKYIRENKLFAPNWYNVWDGKTHTDFTRMWDVYATPVMYVLDENNKIIAKRLVTEQLDEFFNKYIWKINPKSIPMKIDEKKSNKEKEKQEKGSSKKMK